MEQPSSRRWLRPRVRGGREGLDGERGATFVEYALVFSFLAVLSVGASKTLAAAGGAEVNNQADCISTRPAPPACQIRPAVTTTTTTTTTSATSTTTGSTSSTSTSSTTAPTTTTTAPATTTTTGGGTTTTTAAAGSASATLSAVRERRYGPDTIRATVTVTDNLGGNVSGATVRVRFSIWGDTTTRTCTTDGSGSCAVSIDTSDDSVSVAVRSIVSTPPVADMPGSQTV